MAGTKERSSSYRIHLRHQGKPHILTHGKVSEAGSKSDTGLEVPDLDPHPEVRSEIGVVSPGTPEGALAAKLVGRLQPTRAAARD